MIIHGKNVEILFKVEDDFLPKLVLSDLPTTRIIRNKLLRNLLKARIKFNKPDFFKYLGLIIEENIIDVLKSNPELTSSENLRIVVIYKRVRKEGCLYMYPVNDSRGEICVLYMNPSSDIFLFWIIYGYVKDDILHELEHYNDRIKLVRESNLTLEIGRHHYTFRYSENLGAILSIFTTVRAEAIAEFGQNIKGGIRIRFDTASFSQLIKTLDLLATNFNLNNPKHASNIFDEAYIGKGLLHDCGSMMLTIIFLGEAIKNGKEFSVWIYPKTVKNFFQRREYNAKEINKYFGKNIFFLRVTDKEVMPLANAVLSRLRNSSHQEFFKMYEQSCRALGISETFFNADSYHYYATLCIYNYLKYRHKWDNPKIKAQLERFRR